MEENSWTGPNRRADQESSKSKAPRSTKACLACRSRKVRCDALTRAPLLCTNCSLDGLKCELAPRARPSTRRRARSIIRQRSASSRPTRSPSSEVDPAVTQPLDYLEDGNQTAASPIIDTAEINMASSHHLNGSTERQRPFPAPEVANNMELWEDAEPPRAGENNTFPVFTTADYTSHPTTYIMAQDEDLILGDLQNTFPDADILEQYWTFTNSLDPSLTDLLDVNYTDEVISEAAQSGDDDLVFKSPLNWIADWSVKDHSRNRKYAEAVQQRAFNLPSTSEINKLVQFYFSHAHHRLPVLSLRSLYRLITGDWGDEPIASTPPISLALLYAIMFVACAYLRTGNADPSYISGIRSMRCEYYSRAALLFKLGCETDPMRQIQICLLLSTYRSYPGRFYENERWIIKAYRTLQSKGILPQGEHNESFSEQPDWKRVCACWLHRFANMMIGLKWTSGPDLMEAFGLPWHQIDLAVFEEDFRFSWLLSSETKEALTRIFVSRIELCVIIGQLNKILWKRTASEMIAIGEKPNYTRSPPSGSLPMEEIEARFQKWKLQSASLLSMEAKSSAPLLEKRLLRAEQIHTRLTYDYSTSSLYQNTLIIDRALITDWAAGLIRSSRSALWGAIVSIQDTLKETLEEKLVNLLPLNMLIVVFVPLTIYSLHMQTVQAFDPSAIQNLAICSEIARTMGDLHDGADFYSRILSNTLTLAQKYRAMPPPHEPALNKRDAIPNHASTRMSAESVLPEPRLHSLVLRFYGLALALGRMPNIDFVLELFARRVLAQQVS